SCSLSARRWANRRIGCGRGVSAWVGSGLVSSRPAELSSLLSHRSATWPLKLLRALRPHLSAYAADYSGARQRRSDGMAYAYVLERIRTWKLSNPISATCHHR